MLTECFCCQKLLITEVDQVDQSAHKLTGDHILSSTQAATGQMYYKIGSVEQKVDFLPTHISL